MKIALSGYYGFGNVGDEAILHSLIATIKKCQPDTEIIVFSNNPEETRKAHNVLAVNRWSLMEIAKTLSKADLLISGGGSLFQDKTSRKNVIYYAAIIQLARAFKTPVAVYAQGIGPLDKKISRKVVRRVMDSSQYVSVRDDFSRNLLVDIGVKNKIDLVADPVLGVSLENLKSQWMPTQNFQKEKIVVAVRTWNNFDYYGPELAGALDELARQNFHIILLPMHGKYDLEASMAIRGMMASDVSIAPHGSSFLEKALIIKESSLLIGMRLHALIFASIGQTPFAALSYDPKIDAFSELAGQKIIGHVSEQDWNSQSIIAAVEDISENYQTKVAKMDQFVNSNKNNHQYLEKIIANHSLEKTKKQRQNGSL